jgi:hypothetical protein
MENYLRKYFDIFLNLKEQLKSGDLKNFRCGSETLTSEIDFFNNLFR